MTRGGRPEAEDQEDQEEGKRMNLGFPGSFSLRGAAGAAEAEAERSRRGPGEARRGSFLKKFGFLHRSKVLQVLQVQGFTNVSFYKSASKKSQFRGSGSRRKRAERGMVVE